MSGESAESFSSTANGILSNALGGWLPASIGLLSPDFLDFSGAFAAGIQQKATALGLFLPGQ